MMRRAFPVLFGLVSVAALLGAGRREARPRPDGVQWIWFNEGNPLAQAPAEIRYFRRAFTIGRPGLKVVDEATLDITADNAFTVWVNGGLVGSGHQWQRVHTFDVAGHL